MRYYSLKVAVIDFQITGYQHLGIAETHDALLGGVNDVDTSAPKNLTFQGASGIRTGPYADMAAFDHLIIVSNRFLPMNKNRIRVFGGWRCEVI